MSYFLLILFIGLDYLYPFVIPSFFQNLTLFYPMFTLTYLVFLYKKIDYKKYWKISLFAGIIYDLLFSYLFLYHTLVFLGFAKILKKIDKFIQYHFFIKIGLLLLFLFLYDGILFTLVYISGYNVVTISNLFYKFTHSILLNLAFYLWLEIVFFKKKINSTFKFPNFGHITVRRKK